MLVTRSLSSAGQPLRVTAVCAVTDAPGDLVQVAGERVGNDYSVTKVDPLQPNAKPAIGVIIAKISDSRCVVQFEGEVKGVYLDLDPGKHYFAGTDGRPTQTAPSPAAGAKLYLQIVGVALAADTLYLRPEADMKVRKG